MQVVFLLKRCTFRLAEYRIYIFCIRFKQSPLLEHASAATNDF